MTGAAEYIEKVYEDADAMGVLAFDGASSDILSLKLMSLASVDVQGWTISTIWETLRELIHYLHLLCSFLLS